MLSFLTYLKRNLHVNILIFIRVFTMEVPVIYWHLLSREKARPQSVVCVPPRLQKLLVVLDGVYNGLSTRGLRKSHFAVNQRAVIQSRGEAGHRCTHFPSSSHSQSRPLLSDESALPARPMPDRKPHLPCAQAHHLPLVHALISGKTN